MEDTGTSVSGNTISCTGARLGFALVCCCSVSGGGSSKEIPHGGLSFDEKVEGALELAVVGIESSDGGRSTEMGGGRGRGFGTGPVGKIRSSSMISSVPRGFMTRATSWEVVKHGVGKGGCRGRDGDLPRAHTATIASLDSSYDAGGAHLPRPLERRVRAQQCAQSRSSPVGRVIRPV